MRFRSVFAVALLTRCFPVLVPSFAHAQCPPPSFCDNSISPNSANSKWMVEFAASSLWTQSNDDPPQHPQPCPANNVSGNLRTDVPAPNATRPAAIALQWTQAGASSTLRNADVSFKVVAGDLPGFNHLFVGGGEEALGNGSPEQNGGRLGAAVFKNRLYVQLDVKQTPGTSEDTITCPEAIAPETIDCDGNRCPAAGFSIPALVGDRWYRAESQSVRRSDGGLDVTVALTDLVTGTRTPGTFSFPAACTPPWWNMSDDRFTIGVQGEAGSIGEFVDVRVDDFFGRPTP